MTDRVSAFLLLIFSAIVIVEARTLPYWVASAPGPGFLPFWLGVLLACSAAALLLRTLAVGGGTAPHTDGLQALPDRASTIRLAVVVAFTAGAAALGLFIGLVLATGVFMGATLAYLRPGHRRTNLLAAILTPLVVWLLFVRWLAVPLPPGPFGF